MNSERILGIPFFNGTTPDAVKYFLANGGLLVAPASPALLNLKYDAEYRRAMQAATMSLPDSKLLTVAWRAATGRLLRKISGISYLKSLLTAENFRKRHDTFWLVGSEQARNRAMARLQQDGIKTGSGNFRVVSAAPTEANRYDLLTEIERRQPADIILAVPSPVQEKFGNYLREYAMYRPRVHCIGAALSFLTGDERPIPNWAERFDVAWLVRLASQPRMILPRIGIAGAVTSMVLRHKSEMPPLTKRWADI